MGELEPELRQRAEVFVLGNVRAFESLNGKVRAVLEALAREGLVRAMKPIRLLSLKFSALGLTRLRRVSGYCRSTRTCWPYRSLDMEIRVGECTDIIFISLLMYPALGRSQSLGKSEVLGLHLQVCLFWGLLAWNVCIERLHGIF